MLKWIWNRIAGAYADWATERQERLVREVRLKDAANASLDKITQLTNVDTMELHKTSTYLKKRGKEFGLAILLCVTLAGAATAQSAEDRVLNYSHVELQSYALELVQHARDLQDHVDDLEDANRDMENRLDMVQLEIAGIREAIRQLGITDEKGRWSKIGSVAMGLAPLVLSATAAFN